MSSRALRRIQEGSVAQGLPVGPCGGEVSPSSSDPESGSENVKKSPKRAAKAKGNLFDLVSAMYGIKRECHPFLILNVNHLSSCKMTNRTSRTRRRPRNQSRPKKSRGESFV